MKNRISLLTLTIIVLVLTAIHSPAQSTYEPYTFTTLAGNAGYGSTDGTGSNARFGGPIGFGPQGPTGTAVDSAGNVYVADTENNTIRKVTPTGVVTTLAGLAQLDGHGNPVYGSADGTGSAARFNQPTGVAVDSAGNVYVADTWNDTIRKVTPTGVVTTLAGLAGSFGSADGTGSAAQFNYPSGVAVDSSGNVYVADQGNHTIRKVTPAGVVTTLAGLAGNPGSADGTGSAARFWGPYGMAVDSAGNVYVADTQNNTIRKVTPTGVVTTLAGLAQFDSKGNPVGGSADGTGSAAQFNYPSGVAVDSAGNIYVADSGNNTIRKVTPAGVVTTLAGLAARFDNNGNLLAGGAGSADATGSDARFNSPAGVAVDNAGNVYVADSGNNTIREVTPAGVVTTLAGLAGSPGNADGTGSAARFSNPYGVAVDNAGNVYVADSGNHTIRKVTSAGVVTTLAGLAQFNGFPVGGSADGTGSAARFNYPSGVAVDSAGNVYVADTYNYTIRKVTPAGVVTTLAGLAGSSGSADGTGSAARFSNPYGVAVDSAGNVYVADSFNNTIRKVTPAGVVTTLAGLAGSFGSGSTDATGSAARFNYPSGVAVDSAGNVYVADTYNYTIRKVTPAGVVTTLAGDARFGSVYDGPRGVAVDSASNIYVADPGNNTIRKVTPTGVVTTLAGLAGSPGNADGTGSAARFGGLHFDESSELGPAGVAVDSAGNVYVADTANNTIRKGYPENVRAVIVTSAPGFGFNGGKFGFNLTGPAGQLVVVEASSDLMSWLPLWTNTFAGALNFSDPQSGVSSHRFYRAHTP